MASILDPREQRQQPPANHQSTNQSIISPFRRQRPAKYENMPNNHNNKKNKKAKNKKRNKKQNVVDSHNKTTSPAATAATNNILKQSSSIQDDNDDDYDVDDFINICSSPNFVPHAGKGCHIIRYPSSCSVVSTTANATTTTTTTTTNAEESTKGPLLLETVNILGWETDIDPYEDFEEEDPIIPDVAIDPDEHTLTLCNVSQSIRVAYITVYEATCTGQDYKIFSPGTTTNHEGITKSCVTFIVLCPPLTFCTLCHIHPPPHGTGDILDVPIESDIQDWKQHPDPSLKCHAPLQGFPLLGGPFLCTQGMGGHLTHYFSGNLHAIDFRCDVGTPLLAVEDGVVVQVHVATKGEGGNVVTGIGATNLFEWNSILIRHDRSGTSSAGDGQEGEDGSVVVGVVEEEEIIYTEYVHIQSSKVQEGDVVKRGDIIGYSGSVGFSPESHLHFAVYKSGEADAVTVGFQFMGQEDGIPYEPRAGMFYSASGPGSTVL
mmetsp:Transcript_9395/g.17692  ORF Transcript_9395/g.17692 Transcript_9395/m.17692 type:complete len:490 (-) Transcript_9395:1161-2630(-)